MTSGAPLYLVSACGTAEEFVAAFRRYADRTGLFIPSAAPLPAGRRGRLAVTLKDGGVMIEGEAEILQSSAKPTVLHGRPGMTVKFVEPDELSKVVIGELEKARLAMKVPTPTVLPRPASIPAEPRPVVPPVAGRIDAANALAECIVIGDVSVLKDIPSTPRGLGDPGSAANKAKFAVPSIPGSPGRPKTPSVPPTIPAAPSRPKTPSVPPSIPAIGGPPPATTMPAAAPAPKLTSIGFPVIDKVPAKVESAKFVNNATTLGMAPLGREPSAPVVKPDDPLLQTQHGVSGAAMRGPAPAPAPVRLPGVETDDESTTIGEAPPQKSTDPMPTTAPQTTEIAAAEKSDASPRAHAKSHKATSIGFPAMRSPFETQPAGVVPPPTQANQSDPAPPVVAKSKAGMPGPRGKNPTTPPLTPRHPTPVAPLPIVRPPAKSAAALAEDEEKTDLGAVPTPASTVESGRAHNDRDKPVDPHENTAIAPTARSGGMRASEIMAAIPTEDWTMTPEASGPTVLPPTSLPTPVVVSEPSEPTPAPGLAPKGPPTGDWTIQLDPAAPDAGWSPPAKVEPAVASEPKPAKRPKTPAAGQAAQGKSGNPDMAVASKEAFTAVEWEDKPTGIGEAKIEIDSTLMEPLKPMPLDDDPAALMQPLGKVGSSTGPSAAIPGGGTAPASYATGPQAVPASSFSTGPQQVAPTRPEVIPPPLAPMPPVGPRGFSAAELMSPTGNMQAAATPPEYGGFGQMGFGASNAVTTTSGRNKQRLMVIGAAAVVALIGIVVVMLLAGGHKNKNAGGAGPGSALVDHGSAHPTPVPPQPPSGSALENAGSNAEVAVGSGSAEQAVVAPAVVDAGAPVQETSPTPSGTCQVEVTSTPNGADVIVDKKKLGVTPGTFELSCGVEATVTLRKAKFQNTARTVKPVADKPNKLAVKLGKMTFSLKVTSTPAGATITAGGKSAGVTPATIRVPGFEATAITLTKPGFAADTQKVSVKANGQAHHVILKKGGRR